LPIRRRRPYTDVPNAEISYPKRGGFAELYRGFLPSVAPHLRRGNVEGVDLAERLITTTEGDEYRYDEMISTMPLTRLVQAARPVPDEVVLAAASLAHNSLLLVNLVVDRSAVSDLQRVYVADASVPFHKLVLNSNSSPHLRAQPYFGIQAEVAYSSHKPIAEEGLVETVIDSVRRIGVLDAGEAIVASSVTRVPFAYPIYTRSWADAVATIRAFFVARGIHPLGRFGEWAYINSDEAVHRGWTLARALQGATAPIGASEA
jgi:protoporphyrinogen oxidase